MSRPSVFTLLLAIAIAHLLVATSPAANALQGMNLAPPHVARRAEHVDINKKMLRKRRPQDDIVPVNVVESPNTSTTPTATASISASTPANGNGNNGNNNSRTTTTTTAANVLQSLSQLLNGSNTSTQTTTSQSSTTSVASTPSSTPVASQPTSTSTTTSTRKTGTVFVTESATDSAATTSDASDPNSSFLPHSVIIALIVTGSCIAAGAAIWTIIRKWKFSPSRHFEDRLEPINWQPTQSSGVDHDPTMAALGRTGSRNGGRPGSIVSGDEHGSVRNMSSTNNEAISMAPDFPPAHDFTAGPAGGLNPGYVDMHRGPSPAPTQYGAAAYGGQYETPNPYDAYDYNNTSGYGQQQRRY